MDYIAKRVLEEADCILKRHCTIREVASFFNISKSTVHKDLHERLLKIDNKLYFDVGKILEYHKQIRHIRGGEATKNKYLKVD